MLRAAAAERNREPIAEVLKLYFKGRLKLLEIASGTGQHLAHFAPLFPEVVFQPSECEHRSIHSIVAYVDELRLENFRVPLFIDVTKPAGQWALPDDYAPEQLDVIYSANMIHISSNAAVNGLFEAAGYLLKPSSGLLITYGPYAVNGKITPQSNVDFDAGLRTQNPEWGLRDIEFLRQLAASHGLEYEKAHDMPANNKILVFRKKL
ncbi:unnamed protein product, partial [Mesorhabditis belari]|uniref:Methyltransferase-like 26 n=1 Tax=Mesorhabditis belari TaxID=2138241 RepID=A0AAF3EJS6_9BILA